MIKIQFPAAIVAAVLFTSCLNSGNMQLQPSADLKGGAISADGQRFTDSTGRQVIFNGINLVNKNPAENYLFSNTDSIFKRFSDLGFNCVRLGIIWDGMEPEPGKYNEDYLDSIEKQVMEAARHGLYVFLDMHQDLFSVLYSDGAPRWATLSDGLPHITGFVWSDSYLISPAVQRAFDNFWANKPAPGGKGIQDHYADMWRHIAERFSGNKTVIGYDLMNEPFNGSQGAKIIPVILSSYASLYAKETGKVYTENELLEIWSSGESRMKALEWMSDAERYSRVISSATALNSSFEKNELQQMYQRVADRIREVDTTHILFLEHAYFSNTGVRSGIQPVSRPDGTPDPLVAYAAHGYDLLVDTKYYGQSSIERVDYIFSQIRNVADSINRPVILGEWGAFSGNSDEITGISQATINLLEKYGFSQTYWAWYNGLDQGLSFRNSFLRPWPRFINGTLISSGFNYSSGEFTCRWKESPEIKRSTVIFVPELAKLIRGKIIITPRNQNIIIEPMAGSEGGFLLIPGTGEKGERSVSFRLEKDISPIKLNGGKAD